MSEAEYEAMAEERPVVVEHVTVVEEPGAPGEMLRFFVLIIVLGVVVLVVAATRPLIFGKIVPAVMGEGIVIPTEVPVVEDIEEGEQAGEEGEGATAVDAEPGTEEMSESTDTAVMESDTAEADDAVVDTETAVNQTIHRVRQGETLQAIAAQYGVPMQSLIAANQLTNPDLIKIGDELVIPQAEE